MAEEVYCVRHEPCPKCGSRDNLARYSDGHGWCFGCSYYEKGDGEVPAQAARTNKRRPGMIDGEFRALPKRGITEETCRFWNYRVGTHNGKTVQIATYCDHDGNPVAQKLRYADKSFQFLGDPKAATPLYGQHLWRDGGKKLVITEGEIDALTVSQLQGNKWPVVSVKDGAAGAHKSIAKALEWLLRFDQVVFMFDADGPGQKAAKQCAALLPPGKAFIATIPGFKDANEALQAGQGPKVIDAMWGAKEFRPDGIIDAGDVIEEALTPAKMGLPWPWESLTKATYGRRRGEMYGFGAGTGMGKSTLFKQVMAHILEHDKLPVGVIALEEKPSHTLKCVAGIIDGVRYHVPGTEYQPEQLRASLESLCGRVSLYDSFGKADWETVKSKIRYMATAQGIKDIFLDHLTAIAATMGDDERKALDVMMAELSALTLELGISLYFISHLATPEGKPHEEGGRVLEKHFRGSRAIAMWSHFLFGLEGNKQEPGSPRVLRCLKDRYTGDAAGVRIGLLYDRDTGRMIEVDLPPEDANDKSGRRHGFRDETSDRNTDF